MLMVLAKESGKKDAQTFTSTKKRAEINVEGRNVEKRRENAKPQKRMFVVMHLCSPHSTLITRNTNDNLRKAENCVQ